ncbi:MAG: hypothetical protein IPK07_23940 [Deltaproteobacteria bacterium]|nr:hypothetical protein [Deltaproteobacteria bacterium]
MAPFPILFLIATAAVAVGLVWHTVATYGYERGTRLLITLGILGVLHEVICPNGFYLVQMRGFRPLGVPLGVSAGWVITALLGLDFARRMLSAVAPRLVGSLAPTVLLAALFGGALSNAIEPVGQVSGWWIWTPEYSEGQFPHLAGGMWFLTIYLFNTFALATTGLAGRRRFAGVSLLIPFACAAMPLPIPASMGLAATSVVLLARLDALDLAPEFGRRAQLTVTSWSEVVPLGATMLILATLGYYASVSARPDVIELARPAAVLSVAPYVALGVLRLNDVLRSLAAPGTEPRASTDLDSVGHAAGPRAA